MVASRRSSGEILRLAKFQVDRPTVDYPSDDGVSEPLPRSTPTKIGRYTVLDLLGVGGMGVVCTAYDPKLDRKVALKLLRKRGKGKKDSRNSTGQARLIREAQALAKLSHPNIVTVHDVDQFEGQVYMAMEYVDGESLDQWMVRGQRSWREVLEIFIDSARGLAAAHAAGITHRDFKPANVLIGKDGRVLVVDFGLAKSHDDKSQERSATNHEKVIDPATFLRERGSLMDVIGSTQDTKLTQVGRTVGTPAYMAPEQFLGLPVGPETDQFSFGVALFEALYGYLPFPDDSRDELIERVTEGRVAEPPKDTQVPGWVHRVVLRALQQRPEDRFPSMNVLIAALQADPAKRRRRALTIAGGGLLTVLGVYGAVQALAPEVELCTGAEEQMEDVWGASRKATVKATFASIDRAYALDAWERVESELDARAQAWISTHTTICEATNVRGEQSSSLMDLRMACLERRLGEMRALVEVFSLPDEKAAMEAVDAVQGLEDVAGCRTLREDRGLTIDDAELRAKAEEIDVLIAQSKAMTAAGKHEAATEVAASAIDEARALAHQPTLARAALTYALAMSEHSSDIERVRALFVDAIELASQTNQPDLEATGWSRLIVLDGEARGRPEAGLALQLPARLAVEKADDILAEATLESAVGTVLHKNNDHQGALEAQMRALEKYRTALGDRHTRVAGALSNVGVEYTYLGRLDDARSYTEQAATMVESLYGPNHPMLAYISVNLGSLHKARGDLEGAHAAFLQATTVLQGALPKGHTRTLSAMLGLAQTERTIDPVRAAQRLEDVLELLRAQAEPDLSLMAQAYNSHGQTLRMRAESLQETKGDPQVIAQLRTTASESFSAALETLERIPPEAKSPDLLKGVRRNFCQLELDRGKAVSALGHCTAAWDIEKETGNFSVGVEPLLELAQIHVEQGDRARAMQLLEEGMKIVPTSNALPARLELATLLWSEPGQRTRSLELVREAQATLGKDHDGEARALIQAWLDKHPQ